jgi:Scavenger mRNA decapping enzyme C-term binding
VCCCLQFRVGYHAIPSLKPLHVHIISQDLNGHGMKQPKHWNTFATPFFLEIEVRMCMLVALQKFEAYDCHIKHLLLALIGAA